LREGREERARLDRLLEALLTKVKEAEEAEEVRRRREIDCRDALETVTALVELGSLLASKQASAADHRPEASPTASPAAPVTARKEEEAPAKKACDDNDLHDGAGAAAGAAAAADSEWRSALAACAAARAPAALCALQHAAMVAPAPLRGEAGADCVRMQQLVARVVGGLRTLDVAADAVPDCLRRIVSAMPFPCDLAAGSGGSGGSGDAVMVRVGTRTLGRGEALGPLGPLGGVGGEGDLLVQKVDKGGMRTAGGTRSTVSAVLSVHSCPVRTWMWGTRRDGAVTRRGL
jgi:hypothetical protein